MSNSPEIQATPVNSRIAQANEPALRLGMQGDAVKRLQTFLRQRGFYRSPITGNFDSRTEAAVRIAQAVYGLEKTGIVNAATWQALHNSPQTLSEPPDGVPPNTTPGGSRGNCAVVGNQLKALVPQIHGNNVSLTVSAYPTWFFYIPKITTAQRSAEFSLQDEKENSIYRTTITLPATGGIINLTIPAKAPGLQANQSYRWTFSLVCSQDRKSEPCVTGYIQRVERPDLAAKVKQTAVKDVPSVYAAAGIWYEALSSLAQLRRENPDDEFLLLEWTNYLTAANLAYLSTATLLP